MRIFSTNGRVGTVVRSPRRALSDEYENSDQKRPIIRDAEAFLEQIWPEAADQFGRLVRSVYPYIDKDFAPSRWGCTCGHDWITDPWTLYTTVDNVCGTAEGFIHELGHLKLHSLGVHLLDWDDVLITNSKETLYPSPARRDALRPIGAVLQGFYSYVHVLELESRAMIAGDTEVETALRFNRKRIVEGMQTIPGNWQRTAVGDLLWASLSIWANELLVRTEQWK